MKYCCKVMEARIDDKTVNYDGRLREFSAPLFYYDVASLSNLYFCPWCGAKLPDTLRNQWFDEVMSLGIKQPWDWNEFNKIPDEYKSEKWWQDKGL